MVSGTWFSRLLSADLGGIGHLRGNLKKLDCWPHPGGSGCFIDVQALWNLPAPFGPGKKLSEKIKLSLQGKKKFLGAVN